MVRSSCRYKTNMVPLHDASGVYLCRRLEWDEIARESTHISWVRLLTSPRQGRALYCIGVHRVSPYTRPIYSFGNSVHAAQINVSLVSLWKAVTKQMVHFEVGSFEILKEKTETILIFCCEPETQMRAPYQFFCYLFYFSSLLVRRKFL